MNSEWYHTYTIRPSLVAVDDDGVITLTVGTVSLKTGVGLRIFETLAIDDDG